MRMIAVIIWIGYAGPTDLCVRFAVQSWGGSELMGSGIAAVVLELFLRPLGASLTKLAHPLDYGSLRLGK